MARSVDDLELRSVTEDEWPAYLRAFSHVLAVDAPTEQRVRTRRAMQDLDRTVAAFDGERIVGTAATYAMSVSLPGGAEATCDGVSLVSVAPDWTRRGVLSAMMRELDRRAHARGEPFAALFATESAIYRRYGYGLAATSLDLRVPTARVPAPPGTREQVRVVTADHARASWPEIEAAARRRRAGWLTRSAGFWERATTSDPSEDRHGASPRWCVEVPGRGYASYRVTSVWEGFRPEGEVRLELLEAADADAELALWRHLWSVDLTTTVVAPLRPADEPLLHALGGRQTVDVREGAGLQLRLVDVAAALAARGYAGAGTAVLGLRDDVTGREGGTWRLDVDGGVGTAERIRPDVADDADLELGVAALGSVALGGVATTALLDAGIVVERRPGAAAALDRLLTADRAPWQPYIF